MAGLLTFLTARRVHLVVVGYEDAIRVRPFAVFSVDALVGDGIRRSHLCVHMTLMAASQDAWACSFGHWCGGVNAVAYQRFESLDVDRRVAISERVKRLIGECLCERAKQGSE